MSHAAVRGPESRAPRVVRYYERHRNLTQEQIDKVVGDDRTKLPDHLQHPAHWSKGDAVQLKVQPKVGVERK